MNDPFLTRDWTDNHDRFTGDLDRATTRFWSRVMAGLERLHAIQFDAPWHHDR